MCIRDRKYGAPNMIDGWIVKFFPYDKKGQRNNLKQLEGTDSPVSYTHLDVYKRQVEGSP